MVAFHANTVGALPDVQKRSDDDSSSSSESESELSLETEPESEIIIRRDRSTPSSSTCSTPSTVVRAIKPEVPSVPRTGVQGGRAVTLDALPALKAKTLDELPSMKEVRADHRQSKVLGNHHNGPMMASGAIDRKMKYFTTGDIQVSMFEGPMRPATRGAFVPSAYAANSRPSSAMGGPSLAVSRPSSVVGRASSALSRPDEHSMKQQVGSLAAQTQGKPSAESDTQNDISAPHGPRSSRSQSSYRRRRHVQTASSISDSNQSCKIEFVPSLSFLNSVSNPRISPSEYCAGVSEEVKRVLIADHCCVFFVDQLRERLCSASRDRIESIAFANDFAGAVAQSGNHKVIPKMTASTWTETSANSRLGADIDSLVCFPIRHVVDQSATIGVIEAARKKGTEVASFSDDILRACEGLAVFLGDSFSRHRWTVLESCSSSCDAEVSSLVSHMVASEGSAAGAIDKGRETVDQELRNERWPGCLREHDVIGLHRVRSLAFNALEWSPSDLVGLVTPIMQHTGCKDKFGVTTERLQSWAMEAKGLYKPNPFHNWYHGFSCFQMCYFQLFGATLSKCVTSLDTFAVLIAALCHDLDHPGFTNAYLIESDSELALRYNDSSVLENHHASLACGLLRKDATAIAANMHRADQSSLRRTIIRCILDTDMTHHRDMCQKIQAGAPALEDPQLMLSACIHSSDLSAQVLPWEVAHQWESRISEEFSHQASEELSQGRTPPPFMNFALDDLQQRGKLQRDFCDFVLFPLWDPLSQVLPELRPAYRNLVNNRSFYDRRAVHGEEKHVEKKKRSSVF